MANVRLGKLAPRHDSRTLKMARYTVALPEPPAECNLTGKISNLGPMLNDQLGDCVAEGTLIGGCSVRKGYRAPYDGPAISITTESGKRLTVTPNHAVLTSAGFVRAKFLKQGDNLISTTGSQVLPWLISGGGEADLNNTPSPIEQIVKTLRLIGGPFGKVVPVPVDFHGDAEFFQGDIDVVNSNGFLRGEDDASLAQPYCQDKVGAAGELQGALHGSGAALTAFDRGGTATLGEVGIGNEAASFGGTHVLVSKTDGLLDRTEFMSSRLDAGLQSPTSDAKFSSQGLHHFSGNVAPDGFRQIGKSIPVGDSSLLARLSGVMASGAYPTDDGDTTDSEMFGDLLGRYPGQIAEDRIVDINVDRLKGHVYDLSTDSRWYTANGIITHNCTCAAIGHMIQTWTAECGAEVILPDSDILTAYEAFCGYDPKDPSTDQGGVELSVLNGWRKLGVAGHTIAAYVALQIQPSQSLQAAMPSTMWRKLEEQFAGFFGKKKAEPRAMLPELARQLKQGVYFFGGVYIGVELPKTAEDQDIWDVVSLDGDGASGSWGGHAVPIVAYDEQYFYVITWGKVLKVTPAFLAVYMSEAYICVSNDMIGPNGKSPAGLDVPTLLTDLAEVTA